MFSPISSQYSPVVWPNSQPLYQVPQVNYQQPTTIQNQHSTVNSVANTPVPSRNVPDVQAQQRQTSPQLQQNAALALMALQQQQAAQQQLAAMSMGGMSGANMMSPIPGVSPIPGYTMVAVNYPYQPQQFIPLNYQCGAGMNSGVMSSNVQISPVLQPYPSTGSMCRSNSTVSSTPPVPVLKPVGNFATTSGFSTTNLADLYGFGRSSSVTSSVVDGSDFSESNAKDNGSTVSFSRDGYGSERSFRTSESGSDKHHMLEHPNVGSPLQELSNCVFNLAEMPRAKKYTPYWDPNIKQMEENYLGTNNHTVLLSQKKSTTSTTTTSSRSTSASSSGARYYRNGFGLDGKKRPTSKERREELFKSDLCNSWINGKTCRFGKNCIYAHGIHELRKPKRKVERMKNRLSFRDDMLAQLSNMNQSNFESSCTSIIARCVEELSDNEKCKSFVDLVYDRAISEKYLQRVLYCKLWERLLNIHHFRGLLKTEMNDKCICEYKKPRNKNIGLAVTSWISELCKKGLFNKALIHEMLGAMMNKNTDENKENSELKTEMWCRMIEWVHNFMEVKKYVDYLTQSKSTVGARLRFMIMNLEYLDNGRIN